MKEMEEELQEIEKMQEQEEPLEKFLASAPSKKEDNTESLLSVSGELLSKAVAKGKQPSKEGHRERVKRLFLEKGLDGWSEHRALELLLFYSIPRSDVSNLARTLIYTFGSFSGVLDAPYEALISVKGVTPNTASLLKLFPGTLSYYMINRSETSAVVKTSKQAFNMLAPYFLGEKNEKVRILCLDSHFRFLGVRLVAEGSALATDVNMRRIVEEALTLRSIYLYIAHNHVDGDVTPSSADWGVTSKLLDVLFPLNLYLMDHLVISDDKMTSLRKETGPHRPLLWPELRT